MSKAKELDQWFTKPKIAKICIDKMFELGYMDKNSYCIEPSCGEGVFVDELKKVINPNNISAFDIDPKTEYALEQDWLKADYCMPDKAIVIGNPPYGKKGKLATQFINHSFTMVDTVAFILPLTLSTSWTAQHKIDSGLSLIFEMTLPKNSFIFEGKEVNVPSVFQIWKQQDGEHIKRHCRRLLKPQTEHEDFETKIYNKMPTAVKWLSWDWDIAVKRNTKNGEYIISGEIASENYHWILIKAKTKESLKKLIKIDYSKINDNKMTAGMGKADIVKAYKEIK